MGRTAAYLFCALSIAVLSARPVASEEAKPLTPTRLCFKETCLTPTISPWTKICVNETCFISSDISNECALLARAALVEKSGESKKTLGIALPTHVKKEHGLSFAIDQAPPTALPFNPCCSASYEAGPELVDQLKRGRTLAITAVDGDNSAIHRILPLAGFAEAYDGAPAQPKVFENQQRKLQEFLEARAAGKTQECPPQE
jgi:invasion protein IalB